MPKSRFTRLKINCPNHVSRKKYRGPSIIRRNLVPRAFPLFSDDLSTAGIVSLRSKRFLSLGAKKDPGTGFSVFCPREEWGESQKTKDAPFFGRAERRKSRSSDSLCSPTPRKRLLRKLGHCQPTHQPPEGVNLLNNF